MQEEEEKEEDSQKRERNGGGESRYRSWMVRKIERNGDGYRHRSEMEKDYC
jgi:hypothetical protein